MPSIANQIVKNLGENIQYCEKVNDDGGTITAVPLSNSLLTKKGCCNQVIGEIYYAGYTTEGTGGKSGQKLWLPASISRNNGKISVGYLPKYPLRASKMRSER
jgi:hypothetical protein